MADVRLHVNGLATVKVAGTTLGWTVDGVQMDFIGHFQDVYTDCAGPNIPLDVLSYGEEARVTCDMIVYDTDVIKKISTRIYNKTYGTSPNSACGGASSQYGYLMKACSGTFELAITQGSGCLSEDEGEWHFSQAYLVDNHSIKVGTRVTRHQLVFRCLPNSSGVLFAKA